MKHYNTYTDYGMTALQVSETAIRVRGTVYDFQQPVTCMLVKALLNSLSKAG